MPYFGRIWNKNTFFRVFFFEFFSVFTRVFFSVNYACPFHESINNSKQSNKHSSHRRPFLLSPLPLLPVVRNADYTNTATVQASSLANRAHKVDNIKLFSPHYHHRDDRQHQQQQLFSHELPHTNSAEVTHTRQFNNDFCRPSLHTSSEN